MLISLASAKSANTLRPMPCVWSARVVYPGELGDQSHGAAMLAGEGGHGDYLRLPQPYNASRCTTGAFGFLILRHTSVRLAA